MEATYKVDGMTCGGCASAVTKALQRLSPQLEVEVTLDGGRVLVKGEHEESEVKGAVEDAGFDFAGRAG